MFLNVSRPIDPFFLLSTVGYWIKRVYCSLRVKNQTVPVAPGNCQRWRRQHARNHAGQEDATLPHVPSRATGSTSLGSLPLTRAQDTAHIGREGDPAGPAPQASFSSHATYWKTPIYFHLYNANFKCKYHQNYIDLYFCASSLEGASS